MKTNYHTHTDLCRHAQGSAEDYLRSALSAGVSVLGFSDHAAFPDQDYGYRMLYEELPIYFSEVDRLKEAYAAEIVIKKSLEIEYLPKYLPFYEELIAKYKPDYLLLGEHFFLDEAGEFHNITAPAEDTSVYVSYARAIAEALKTGYFQMVAHPDIFAMSKLPWDRNCDAATDIILEAAALNGVILEFNANGFRRGIHEYPDGERYMYPHRKFWERAVGSKVPVIVGSDCHNPTQVWDEAMSHAMEVLAQIGITPFETMEDALGR